MSSELKTLDLRKLDIDPDERSVLLAHYLHLFMCVKPVMDKYARSSAVLERPDKDMEEALILFGQQVAREFIDNGDLGIIDKILKGVETASKPLILN